MLVLKLNHVSKRGPRTIQFCGCPCGIWYFCEFPRKMSYFLLLIVIWCSVLSFITILVSCLTSMILCTRPVGTERYVDLKFDPEMEQVEGGVLMRKCKMNTFIYRFGVIPLLKKSLLPESRHLRGGKYTNNGNVASVIDVCSNILTVKTVLSLPRWHRKENDSWKSG